jgi:polysaccharide export outer membrane protein
MIQHKSKFSLFTFLTLIFFSCASKKNIVYFQESSSNQTLTAFNPKLEENDMISINVFCLDNQCANFTISNASSTNNRGYSNGYPAINGYLISQDGEIDFPLIGKIKVIGLSLKETEELLKEKLSIYVKNPIVNIQIINFKITILGDVRSPGTFLVPNERITLLEAIGLAGDLNISGKRNNILVVRVENNSKKEYRIDLTKKDLFTSPVYYLKQNDIVYIEPNKAKINSSAVSSSAGIILSLASLFITTINLISK